MVLCLSPGLSEEGLIYCDGRFNFVVSETPNEYIVDCVRASNAPVSRNKNITDRQSRIAAIDLIGTYIIYKDSEIAKSLPQEYFPLFVEGLNLHYDAVLESLTKEISNNSVKYRCKKENYIITSASYNKYIDIDSLLVLHYSANKNEQSAKLLYGHSSFDGKKMAILERDFLSGNARIPSGIRILQNVEDRFEASVFFADTSGGPGCSYHIPFVDSLSKPYALFSQQEIVTAAPLGEKNRYFNDYKALLSSDGNVYESILAFCAKNCAAEIPSESDACFTSIIESFPGAISPFGIRRPIDDTSYRLAAVAYSKSEFAEAARILSDSIDGEGITEEALNLLGASYRFLESPKKALPYLLLCFKINPKTPYLVGNIYMCLSQMGFERIEECRGFLSEYIVDSWSKELLR